MLCRSTGASWSAVDRTGGAAQGVSTEIGSGLMAGEPWPGPPSSRCPAAPTHGTRDAPPAPPSAPRPAAPPAPAAPPSGPGAPTAPAPPRPPAPTPPSDARAAAGASTPPSREPGGTSMTDDRLARCEPPHPAAAARQSPSATRRIQRLPTVENVGVSTKPTSTRRAGDRQFFGAIGRAFQERDIGARDVCLVDEPDQVTIRERVILSHGDIITSDARRSVARAWRKVLIDKRSDDGHESKGYAPG